MAAFCSPLETHEPRCRVSGRRHSTADVLFYFILKGCGGKCGRSRWNGRRHKNPFKVEWKKSKIHGVPSQTDRWRQRTAHCNWKMFFLCQSHRYVFSPCFPFFLFFGTHEEQKRSEPMIGLEIQNIWYKNISRGGNFTSIIFSKMNRGKKKKKEGEKTWASLLCRGGFLNQ